MRVAQRSLDVTRLPGVAIRLLVVLASAPEGGGSRGVDYRLPVLPLLPRVMVPPTSFRPVKSMLNVNSLVG